MQPIKTSLLICTTALALSACGTIKTNQVSVTEARPVPSDRVFALQEKAEGDVSVTVIRDWGMLGGGCYLALHAYGKMIARLDTSEKVTFFLKPGEHELAVGRDPMGTALCSEDASVFQKRVVEKHLIKSDSENLFRLSSRMYRRPELEPGD